MSFNFIPLNSFDVEFMDRGFAGRRLSVRWLVRVRFTVEAYNAVQNKALLQRVGQLGVDSAVSKSFQEELSIQLTQRGVDGADVNLESSTPLQTNANWSPVPSPPTATTSVAAPAPPAVQVPDEGSSVEGVPLGVVKSFFSVLKHLSISLDIFRVFKIVSSKK